MAVEKKMNVTTIECMIIIFLIVEYIIIAATSDAVTSYLKTEITMVAMPKWVVLVCL